MMNTQKRLHEIQERKKEIRALLQSGADVDLDALNRELREMEQEQEDIESRHRTAAGIQNGSVQARTVASTFPPARRTVQHFENMRADEVRSSEEYRGAFLKVMQGRDDLTDIEKRALTAVGFTTGAGSAGPVIPTAIHAQVIQRLQQTAALFPHISVSFLEGNVTIPVELTSSGATWVDELDNIPETEGTIGSVKLGGFTLAKLIPVSIAAESMTASAFEAYLVLMMADKMRVALEEAILTGTGTGQPTGILTGVTWTPNANAFQYDGGDGLTYDDILKPLAAMGSEYLPRAMWSMRSSTLFEQVAKVTGADGKSIFVPDAVEGFAGRIMGKPVVVNDHLPAGTILFGAFAYYFMNFSQPILLEKSRESGFRRATVDYRTVAVLDAKPALDEAFMKLEPGGGD